MNRYTNTDLSSTAQPIVFTRDVIKNSNFQINDELLPFAARNENWRGSFRVSAQNRHRNDLRSVTFDGVKSAAV